MTTHIAVRDDQHACYSVTDSGKGRYYHGCEHATPRLAIAHSDALDAASPPEPSSPNEDSGYDSALAEAPHQLAEVIGGERGHGVPAGPAVPLAAGPATLGL